MFSDNNDDDNKMVTIGRIDIDASKFNNKPDLKNLPMLVTKNLVLFPEVVVPLALGREGALKLATNASDDGTPLGVVCQLNSNDEHPDLNSGLSPYGVVADVLNIFDLPDGSKTALLKSRKKFKIESISDNGDYPVAHVRSVGDRVSDPDDLHVVMDAIHTVMEEVMKAGPDGHNEEIKANMKSYPDDLHLLDYLCTIAPIDPSDKMAMLACGSYNKRAEMLLGCLYDRLEKIRITREIMMKAKENLDNNNRNAFLQQQMETIREELYGDSDEADRLLKRADELNLPQQARQAFDKELGKLRRLNPTSPDYAVAYSYIEVLLDLPWGKLTDYRPTFEQAREVLESDHYGLEKVKERILEQLALIINNPGGKAPILCLVGPPGVGKTSLGKSVAKALGRNYQRVSLGGLHDEAEIRGHRRTYIGAMPGRIIDAIKRAGSSNPVLLLDEVDKIGRDFKGDPEAALLEVLDPEQNKYFHDNYIDIDYDLSKVLFIATANTLSTLQQPLLDRLEIIDLSGYLQEEKVEIAKRHLLPRVLEEHKLEASELKISDGAINHIIEEYTSESGVRQLEKRLAAIARKLVLAKVSGGSFPKNVKSSDLKEMLGTPIYNKERYEGNDFAGVVTGLAWTQVGGEILLVEVSLAPGKGDRLTVTGNLGDVMKESASIALQWVKSHAGQCGIDAEMFDKNNVHIHFPEGAIPKDGPSAGITMATALVSAFTGRKLKERIAMTGEITLRGRVLPVGGIKEKILAAKRAGIEHIILSKENQKNVEDIPTQYRKGLDFIYVDTVSDVISAALSDEYASIR